MKMRSDLWKANSIIRNEDVTVGLRRKMVRQQHRVAECVPQMMDDGTCHKLAVRGSMTNLRSNDSYWISDLDLSDLVRI